jgi:hypothetical protein
MPACGENRGGGTGFSRVSARRPPALPGVLEKNRRSVKSAHAALA